MLSTLLSVTSPTNIMWLPRSFFSMTLQENIVRMFNSGLEWD